MKKELKHIKKVVPGRLQKDAAKAGCLECQTSCQSACKTSCTIGNQVCER